MALANPAITNTAIRTAYVLLASESMSADAVNDRRLFETAWNALLGDADASHVLRNTVYKGDMSGSARQVIDLMAGHITLERALHDVTHSGLGARMLMAIADELTAALKAGAELQPEALRHNLLARMS